MQMLPVRFVIFGCGRMGRLHLERLRDDGRGVAVALFDTDAAAIEALRAEFAPMARGFTNVDELLAETSADAAIVGTPTSLHFEHVRACRERGWHVLCEKPLADRRQDLVEMIAASHSGPILSVGYQRRYWPVYRALRDELVSGRWGRIQAITSINSERWQQTIHGTWRDDPTINLGGFIGDAGSHKLDIAFFVSGLSPVEVFARNQTCGSQVKIMTAVSAMLSDDVPLTMHFTGNAQHFREDLHVHCEHADLLLRDWQLWLCRGNSVEPLQVADSRWQPVMGVNPITNPALDRLGNPVNGFLDQLLQGSAAVAPPECALPVFDFTQAVLRSGKSQIVERTDSR